MKGQTVNILLNKDKYIEFQHPANEVEQRHFRFLVPISKLKDYGRGLFAGPKSSLPIVEKALKVRGYEVKIKEDWV